MLSRIKEEYRDRKIDFYMNIMVEVCSTKPQGAIRDAVTKDSFNRALLKLCNKLHMEDYYDELVLRMENYWDEFSFVVNEGKGKGLVNYLYYIALICERMHYAINHDEEVYDLNLLKELIDFLEEKRNVVFVDFEGLSKVLDESSLSKNEKTDLLLEIIRLNNKRFKSGNFSVPVNKGAIFESDQTVFSNQALDKLARFNAVDFLEELNLPFSKTLIKNVDRIREEEPYDTTKLTDTCASIIELIDEKNVLDDLVKEELLSCLDYLHCSYIYNTLAAREVRTSKKQVASANQKKTIKKVIKKELPKNVSLTKKKTNEILREIKQFYNFDTAECLKMLTMDEIVDCVAGLIKTNASSETIKTFIFSTEKYLRSNPITAYYELLDKMKESITDEVLLSYMDEVEVLIESLYHNADNEEKCIRIMEQISEYIKLLNYALGEDYSYEIGKAKKLVEGTHESQNSL